MPHIVSKTFASWVVPVIIGDRPRLLGCHDPERFSGVHAAMPGGLLVHCGGPGIVYSCTRAGGFETGAETWFFGHDL